MKEPLQGCVAIVTGGARGIGAEISARLVSDGASIVIADSGVDISGKDANPEIAVSFADKLGTRAIAHTGDLGDSGEAARTVEVAVEHFGGIDIVVNNAAILRDSFLFKGRTEDWDAVIRNNLSAAYYLLAAATPVMRRQAGENRGSRGRIVSIVSTAGVIGNYGQASYAAAKGGLIALTRIAALDMARSGVTANAVAPFAHTRVTEIIQPANAEQASYKERALKVPASRVADFVAWLCSDDAAGVTGQLFGVRGREIMLFAQGKKAASATIAEDDWSAKGFSNVVTGEFASQFVDLSTDLELFNTDPAV